jgi:hypothetical protein
LGHRFTLAAGLCEEVLTWSIKCVFPANLNECMDLKLYI